MRANSAFGGIALIILAAVLWGTTGTAQTFAPLTLSSYWVGAARLLIASLFFVCVLLVREPRSLSPARLATLPWRLLLIAGLCMASYNLLFFAAIRATSVAIGTALALGSGPLWAGLLHICMTRQRPALNWWIAVGIAITGLSFATVAADKSVALQASGILLCLLSGASYALYAMTTKRIVSQAPAALSTGLVFTVAAVFAAPGALVLAGAPILTFADSAVLLWLGIVATGIAYLLFSTGLKTVNSGTGVALALVEPVAAVCLAIFIVGERPGLSSITGMGIVLLGLGLLIRIEVRSAAR